MDAELYDLQTRIAARFERKGPAALHTLATELKAPRVRIWVALQKLREGSEQVVEFHPDGLWDLTAVYRRKKSRQLKRPKNR